MTMTSEGAGEQAAAVSGIRVITDGAVALDPGLAATHDISIVPMGMWVVPLAVEGPVTPLVHGPVQASAGGRLPEGRRTSAPSPGEFLEAVTRPPIPAGAVIVTVAARLSASYRTALTAADLAATAGGPPVHVVESQSAAGGQALVALAAARAAAAGATGPEVAAAARSATTDIRLLGAIGSLDALVRGGRVPGLAAAAGRLAGMQPMFELRSGRVRPLRPAFSRSAALDRLVTALAHDRRPAGGLEIAVSHAQAEADAEELLTRLKRQADPVLVTVGAFSPAMLEHSGPGTLGLSWRWRPGS